MQPYGDRWGGCLFVGAIARNDRRTRAAMKSFVNWRDMEVGERVRHCEIDVVSP